METRNEGLPEGAKLLFVDGMSSSLFYLDSDGRRQVYEIAKIRKDGVVRIFEYSPRGEPILLEEIAKANS